MLVFAALIYVLIQELGRYQVLGHFSRQQDNLSVISVNADSFNGGEENLSESFKFCQVKLL